MKFQPPDDETLAAIREWRAQHPSTDQRVRACCLSVWDGTHGCCRWCGDPLRGTRSVWCSDECSKAYTRNHAWNRARGAALRRDDFTCQECGRKNGDIAPPGSRWPTVRVEVHHLTPVRGRHGQFSCLHHLDGLVTLCTACHLEEHARLRAEDGQLSL